MRLFIGNDVTGETGVKHVDPVTDVEEYLDYLFDYEVPDDVKNEFLKEYNKYMRDKDYDDEEYYEEDEEDEEEMEDLHE